MNRPNPAWKGFIPSGGINDSIARWHENQPDRVQTVASPSTLTECPRAVWLRHKHKVPPTNKRGWGQSQRLLLGRNFENQIAEQLKDDGKLLWHWADNFVGESDKFVMGEGLDRIEGTPDLLLNLDGHVVVSDSKTSRADSFAYVPVDPQRIWDDPLWNHYRLQVTAYYMLCHKNHKWFENNHTVLRDEKGWLPLPLPEACHLFSFALDDGVIKREITWKPNQDLMTQVVRYARRWNAAYASETIPDCVCEAEDGIKFCNYAYEFTTTRTGYKLGTRCCKTVDISNNKEIQANE